MRMLSKRSRTESPLPNIISPAIVRPSLRVFWSVVISPMLRRGTIFQGPQLEMFKSVQEGQTDSERILYYIIDEVNKKQDELGWPLTPEERFRLLDELVTRLSVGNKLNLLVWDGEYMYVHTYQGTLHMLQKDADTLWFSTRPLDDAPWQAVPFLRLLVFREGRLVFQGEGDSQEYFDPEKDFEYKRLDFANL